MSPGCNPSELGRWGPERWELLCLPVHPHTAPLREFQNVLKTLMFYWVQLNRNYSCYYPVLFLVGMKWMEQTKCKELPSMVLLIHGKLVTDRANCKKARLPLKIHGRKSMDAELFLHPSDAQLCRAHSHGTSSQAPRVQLAPVLEKGATSLGPCPPGNPAAPPWAATAAVLRAVPSAGPLVPE